MKIVRFHTTENVLCKPWVKIIKKYKDEGYIVEISFSLEYVDSVVSVENEREFADTIGIKGEPATYYGGFWVKKHKERDVAEKIYDIWFESCDNKLRVSSDNIDLINGFFDIFAQTFDVKYCNKNDIPKKKTEKEKIVFLGYAFDDMGKSFANKLSEFFNLLGFEVLTGEKFAPKSVSDKVKERLNVANIIVILLTPDHDLTWLIQEAATESKEKPVIFVVDVDAVWKPGIHSDIECIVFPKNNIEGAFIKIMQGLDESGFTTSFSRGKSIADKKLREKSSSSE